MDPVAWLAVFLMASPSHPSRDCSQVIDHSHVPEFEVAPWIKITLILVYLVIFAVGILGNSVTIRVTQVLQKKGYLQKEVTDHMVSLACSDILVFLIGMPMEFYSIIWNPPICASFLPFFPWFLNCFALNSGHFTAIGCKGTAFFSYTKHFYAKSFLCT